MARKNDKTALFWKIALIVFGLFLSFILTETFLQTGAAVFLYLQESQNKQALSEKGSYRIICLGESTTAAQHLIGKKEDYPTQLEEFLNDQNTGTTFSIINKGIPGINTNTIINELTENLIKYNPDMVIAMMGINDTGKHIPQENLSRFKFFKRLKTYKLMRLLTLHMKMWFSPDKPSIVSHSLSKIQTHPSKISNTQTNNVNNYFTKGWNYNMQGEFVKAEEVFKTAIKNSPQDDQAYVGLGWSYYRQGKLTQAEEAYKNALDYNPKNDQAYMNLGLTYTMQGRKLTQAEEIYKIAIMINPANDNTYLNLGINYNMQNKFAQAKETLEKALTINPKNGRAHLELGYTYLKQKEYARAKNSFLKALKNNPSDDRIYRYLSTCCKKMGNYTLAEKLDDKVEELNLNYCTESVIRNYRKLKSILDEKSIPLICVQYPMRSIAPLKKIFQNDPVQPIFVDNEKTFKTAVTNTSYAEYFTDIFAGDFGHCTPKGYKLLAETIGKIILKTYFKKD